MRCHCPRRPSPAPSFDCSVLQDPARYTLPIGLSNMIGVPEYQTHYGILMAGTLLSILPVGVLFFVLQRDFVSGLASGAVKG